MGQTEAAFGFEGGALWLDFVNTQRRRQGAPLDQLTTPDQLARWGRAAGVLPRPIVPTDAQLAAARTFRTVLRRLAGRLATGTAPTAGAPTVRAINAALAGSRRRPTLRAEGGALVVASASEEPDPVRRLLGAVAESAAEALTQAPPGRVKQCSAGDCVLFFYDASRNGRRRWCSMDTCGNRAKGAAFYARRRSGRRPGR